MTYMDQFVNRRSTNTEQQQKRDLSWPEPPKALEFAVVDNHAHLDFADGDPKLGVKDHLLKAIKVGVKGIITIGCDLKAARWTHQLVTSAAKGNSEEEKLINKYLRAGVSIHPNEAVRHAVYQSDLNGAALPDLDTAISEISQLLKAEPMVTIGETGLDWFRTSRKKAEHRQAQISSFEKHIELAHQLDMPMQIHDREAHQDVLDVLDRVKTPQRTVFHCFSGDAQFAKEALARGAWLSFAGTLTFKNAAYLREALAVTPLDRILVETDAPYLTPHPYRGRPNSSYLIPYTLEVIAKTKGVSLEQVSQQIAKNTYEVYGFSPVG